MTWIAGYNPVGYMPESEPAAFDTWDEARQYLIVSIETFKEEDAERGNERDDYWDDLIMILTDASSEWDWSAQNEDWSFWIVEQEDEQ